MYRSEACWKTVREVTNGPKNLNTKKDKYDSLKENIRILVIGFGWKKFKQAWSKDGNPYSIEFLADALKDIIRKSRKMEIPKAPPINIPKRKLLPVLGEQTEDVKKLDTDFIADKKNLKRMQVVKTSRERKVVAGVSIRKCKVRWYQKLMIHLLERKLMSSFCLRFLMGGRMKQG